MNALAREIVQRANSRAWGPNLPVAVAADTAAARTVQFIGADNEHALAVRAELQTTLAALSPALAWWEQEGGGAVSHVLVLLSRSILAAGSESAAALARAVEQHSSSAIVYLYLEPTAATAGGEELETLIAERDAVGEKYVAAVESVGLMNRSHNTDPQFHASPYAPSARARTQAHTRPRPGCLTAHCTPSAPTPRAPARRCIGLPRCRS